MPLISVIIPMYNAESTVEAALASVRAQTWRGAFEIFVIDDGSTDKGADVVRHYMDKFPDQNITLIQQENAGVSAARNAGLRAAKGEYMALLDADDVWYADKTQLQMHWLSSACADVDFIACRRKNQKLLFPYRAGTQKIAAITFRKLLIRNEAQPSSVIFKRDILQNTGYFDDSQRYAEDLNYWLRISAKNQMYILDEELILAGSGKRTFGVSGLSANLHAMEAGFHKNLREMRKEKRLQQLEFYFYSVFYRLKYSFRVNRHQVLNRLGR